MEVKVRNKYVGKEKVAKIKIFANTGTLANEIMKAIVGDIVVLYGKEFHVLTYPPRHNGQDYECAVHLVRRDKNYE